MRRWFLLFLAACYAPKLQSNVPCSEDLHCPDGQSCQLVGGMSLCISGDSMLDAPVAMIDAPTGDALLIDGALPNDAAIDASSLPDAMVDAAVMTDAMLDAALMLDAMADATVMPDAMADAAVVPDAMADAAVALDAAIVDTDGDGIPDSLDNCPTVANADQANEDGDRFGDACDPCPPIADDNPPDTDGDGVADACDPRPTTTGDRIVLFEGFHAGIPNTWQTNGSWSGSNGNAVVASGSGAGTSTLTIAQALVEPYVVSAAITPTSFAVPGPAGIGPVVRYNNSAPPPAGVECDAIESSSTLTLLDLNTQIHEGGQSITFTAGTAYTLAVGKTTGVSAGYACALSNNGNFTTVFTPGGVLGTRLGVRATGTAAAVAWIMVIDASGP